MCLYPKLIKNPKYKKTKKNGGIIPPILDERVLWVPIGCNQCIECRKQKAREWQVRIQEDLKTNKMATMITLTFNNESYRVLTKLVERDCREHKIEPPTGYDMDNAIATKAVRLFLERWRKKWKHSLRHWLVTELGHNGTENIHLHGILWTDNKTEITEKWGYGYTWAGEYVNSQTVNYIIKYVTKQDLEHPNYKPIVLTSAGIGSNYTKTGNHEYNKFKGENTREVYRTEKGEKIALPIYYRNKLYSEDEREKLWLQKLDKQERWVMGIKVDVSQNEDRYYQMLEEAQEKNKRLGYGDGSKHWEQEQYERNRRIMKQQERINSKINKGC